MKKKVAEINGFRFTWQIGYAAFSVSPSKVDSVKKYIKHQEKHHQTMSYREEIERFMGKSDVVEYNPDYFWK